MLSNSVFYELSCKTLSAEKILAVTLDAKRADEIQSKLVSAFARNYGYA